MNEYDVLVIGGGAAGLSAALVLSRARRRVAVVDNGRPRNAPASHMHGFLSRDGTAPAGLLSKGRDEVIGYGGDIISGAVTDLEGGFRATLADGTTILARRVLVTTGLRDEIPDVPGLADRWGRDVLHCPYCHGYEVRDQPLGVLGGDEDAVAHALLIRQWSSDLILFTDARSLTPEQHKTLAARGILSRPWFDGGS
ncbi:MAG: NAD(P)/FAD-dependent oxidoreductase [Actinobacteria bacterium]|nr:NAD(P)/FAD-dependent oxidoreductase [Actinomycetota bacterium]